MKNREPQTLVAKRRQWLEALTGTDRHAITNQLTEMCWDFSAWHMVNEARGLAADAPEGGVQLNAMIHNLLDRCFFASQLISIRRLMDKSPLVGKEGVYSLLSILNDMKKNRYLLTRKAIFDAEGLAYDYSSIRQKREAYSLKKLREGNGPYLVPRELVYSSHEQRHQEIDGLVRTSPSNRREDDTIPLEVLCDLSRKLEGATETIIDHVNKIIAHAATPESRAYVRTDDIVVSDLWSAHQHLCETAGFIASYILGAPCGNFLAHPVFDHFLYMERPLIELSHKAQLEQAWTSLENECDAWSKWYPCA